MYSRQHLKQYAKQLNISEEFIPQNEFMPVIIKLIVYGNEGRHGFPNIDIRLNKDILFAGTIQGKQVLEFSILPNRIKNLFSISFINKAEDDTMVEDGVITKDKYIQLQHIEFDDIPLDSLKYFRYCPDYPQGYLQMVSNPPKVTYTDFLSFNGRVTIYFEPPVGPYLAKHYFKDSTYAKSKEGQTINNFKLLADMYTKLADKK